MRAEGRLSPKGQQRAAQIIDAALRCLARDGYAATSIQRVADEAGVHKRVVLYYYGSREGLFDHVVRHLGARLFNPVRQKLEGLEGPADIVTQGYEEFWRAVTRDRALLVAWFGLRAEAITNDALRSTASHITDRLRELVQEQIDGLMSRGGVLLISRDSLEVLLLAGVQGLLLDYLERGDTPQLAGAIRDFQRWLTAAFQTVP